MPRHVIIIHLDVAHDDLDEVISEIERGLRNCLVPYRIEVTR